MYFLFLGKDIRVKRNCGTIMEAAMKNKVFAIILVMAVIFLAILWHREQEYRGRLKHLNVLLAALNTRIQLLELKSKALKIEIEMVDISNHLKMSKGLKNEKKKIAPVAKIKGGNDDARYH
jgi:uncharacterized membrane protein YfhO